MRAEKDFWDFPVMEGVTFSQANRVHPLMQARVEKILRALLTDQNVSRAVLFGSALEFRCNSASDIDLYIEKYEKDRKLENFPDVECEVDIVTNLPADSKLYREIDRTGLLLLERERKCVI